MEHELIPPGEMHAPHQWRVADAAARLALTVGADDLGKYAWQQDDNSEWFLSGHTPAVWTQHIGPQGEQGIQGIQGAQGIQGIQGVPGADGADGDAADTAAVIHAAVSKATPVDADELGLADSADTWALKKLTWANLKTTLGSLFVGKTGDHVMAGNLTVPSLNGGQLAGHRNKLINANFQINQRRRSGTVTLAAGEYGHDMWKGGASGCTYTFSSSGGVTTLTITAGSLVQVIEGTLLQTGTFVLGWNGTAQGKIGAGSYSASGVTSSVTGGSNLNIEFNTGTLALPQFEPGSIPTLFEHRIGELYFCQDYFFRMDTVNNSGAYATFAIGEVNGAASITCQFLYPRPMRVPPTMSGSGLAVSAGGAVRVPTTFIYDFIGESTCRLNFQGMSGMTVGWAGRVIANNNNTAYIQGSSEL